MGGNVIAGNEIGTNNIDGGTIRLAPPAANVPDKYSTGILIASSSQLTIRVSRNSITDNQYGVWGEGAVTVIRKHNRYARTGLANYYYAQ